MKNKTKVELKVDHGDLECGMIGYVDGYVRDENNEPCAVLITGGYLMGAVPISILIPCID